MLDLPRASKLFFKEDFISVQSHDADTFDLAAQLRGKRGVKFVDALHYATALKTGCKFFVTNDDGFKSDAPYRTEGIRPTRDLPPF